MNEHPNKKSRWRNWLGYLALAAVVYLVMTGTWPTTPPLGVSYRSSAYYSGKVLKITNISSKTLFFTLHVENSESNQRRAAAFTIKPGDIQEVGVLEMNWNFEPGEKVEIYAKGYLFPITATIPK